MFAEGYSTEKIADFLDVTPRSVWRWLAVFYRADDVGLADRPGLGLGPLPELTRLARQDTFCKGNRRPGPAICKNTAERLRWWLSSPHVTGVDWSV